MITKKRILSILILAILGLINIKSFGTHIMGGEITYRYLGGNKYSIKAKIYRDCRGVPMRDSSKFTLFNKARTVSETIIFKRIAINNASNNCSKLMNPCLPINKRAGKGVEEHIFEKTIDFNIAPYNKFLQKNFCQVYIGFSECCR